MISALGRLLLISFLSGAALAQTTFEVASIQRSSPGEPIAERGGPGTSDPMQFTYTGVPLAHLIVRAYDVQRFRIVGLPEIATPFFDIRAKVPPGTTRPQFQVMLQSLLGERFGLRVHHEDREVPGYELVIAKNGPKLRAPEKSSTPVPEGTLELVENRNLRMGKDGSPQLVPGHKGLVSTKFAGGNRITARMQSIADIVGMCQTWAGRPVVDKTGLKGIYDFDLDFNLGSTGGRDDSTLQPFEFALALQLGLKLQPKKLPFDVIVIDHIEKTPTEN
jgi:uncharacterized protein (TIGR03435 family)